MEDLSLKPQPGFGFRPKDSELVSYFLRLKNYYGSERQFERILEIDLRKMEPWDILRLYLDLSVIEKDDEECFFFSSLDRKYRSGERIDRATESGYWKPTGNKRKILARHSDHIIGWKTSLVFYMLSDRKNNKGKRTNWILHEYQATENQQGAYAVYRLFIPSGKKAFNSNRYEIEPTSSSPTTTESSPDGTPSTPAPVQATPESDLQGSNMWLVDNFDNMMVDSLPPIESHRNSNMASMEDHESEPISSSPTTIESSPGGTPTPTPTLVPVTVESDMEGIKKSLVDNSDNMTSDTLLPEENHSNRFMASGMDGHESEGTSEEDPQGDEDLFPSLTKESLLEIYQEFDFDSNQSPVFQNGTSDEYSNKVSGSDKVTLAEQVGVKASDQLGPSMFPEAFPALCLSNSSSNTLAEHCFVTTPTPPSTAYTLPAVESESLSCFNTYDGNFSFMPNSWQSTHI